MTNQIKIGIVGLGNCSASLLMGLQYYKYVKDTDDHIPGLMHNSINGYLPSDIECVLAYDIDARKIGKPIEEAIFSAPNNTKIFYKDIPKSNVIVKMGQILDGFSDHLLDYDKKYRIVPSKEQEPAKEEVIRTLKESNTQILLNYCPVGSVRATKFYAECCFEAGVSFINNIPVFIASDPEWANRFKEKGIPILGDDIKSQLGSTIINRAIVQMIQDRGGKIVNSWQTNFGGNNDFLTMLDPSRLKSKKISKTESISSLLSDKNNYIYAGPNGFIECLSDNKISFMRIDFKIFGDIDCHIDVKLDVEDSPNSAGVVIDCIRLIKIGLDRHIGGYLLGPSAFYFKHPPVQYPDHIAKKMVEEFISGIMTK